MSICDFLVFVKQAKQQGLLLSGQGGRHMSLCVSFTALFLYVCSRACGDHRLINYYSIPKVSLENAVIPLIHTTQALLCSSPPFIIEVTSTSLCRLE